jgi:hypothetical protein
MKVPIYDSTPKFASASDLATSIKTGPWTAAEDQIVFKLVTTNGPHKWTFIASHLPGRIGKQCRERWHNHLNPSIRKEDWKFVEEWLLFLLHKSMGNSWADIAKIIRGRTDNSIKNHWNSSLKKKLPEFTLSYQNYLRLHGHPSSSASAWEPPFAQLAEQPQHTHITHYSSDPDGTHLDSTAAEHTCEASPTELTDCVWRRQRRSWSDSASGVMCSAVYGQVLEDALKTYKDFTDRTSDREKRPRTYAGQVQEANFFHASFTQAFRGSTPKSKRTLYLDSCHNCSVRPQPVMSTPEFLKSPFSVGSFVFESPSRMLDFDATPLRILRFE